MSSVVKISMLTVGSGWFQPLHLSVVVFDFKGIERKVADDHKFHIYCMGLPVFDGIVTEWEGTKVFDISFPTLNRYPAAHLVGFNFKIGKASRYETINLSMYPVGIIPCTCTYKRYP